MEGDGVTLVGVLKYLDYVRDHRPDRIHKMIIIKVKRVLNEDVAFLIELGLFCVNEDNKYRRSYPKPK